MRKLLINGLIVSGIAVLFGIKTSAQIVPDKTLGTENSVITPEDIIEGGAIRNSNLFHSFQEFNVGEGQQVYFANPEGITNILSRVTGKNISEIFGTLGVNGLANLFFINPNGIVFGENAKLAVGGSFFASTGEGVIFDNYSFSATNPQSVPLLTINVPIGLQMGTNPGEIKVEGTGHDLMIIEPIFSPIQRQSYDHGLTGAPGKTLGLVGGKITFDGGIVTTPGGRIEIGSVRDGVVSFNGEGKLEYLGVEKFGEIIMSNSSLVDGSGESSGEIKVQGSVLQIKEGSVIWLQNRGAQPSGNIEVNTSESIEITGSSLNLIISAIRTDTIGEGKGGNTKVTTNNMKISNGGEIITQTFGRGEGGKVFVEAREKINITGFSRYNLVPSGIFTSSNSVGNGGKITLSTVNLTIKDGSSIGTTAFGIGKTGDITVNVADTIEISGFNPINFTVNAIGTYDYNRGNAGNLTVTTSSLILRNGGNLSTATFAYGQAGNVMINATKSIEIEDKMAGVVPINPAQIGSSAPLLDEAFKQFFGLPEIPSGNAGNVIINTPVLRVSGEGLISVKNDGTGNPGTVNINADSIILKNGGEITASTNSGTGGNIAINTGTLQLENGLINASTSGSGDGGIITINARESLEVIGEGSQVLQERIENIVNKRTVTPFNLKQGIFTLTLSSGNAGIINIFTPNLQVSNGGFMATTTFDEGAGGNINLEVGNNLKIDNSLLATGTFTAAPSGDININARQLTATGDSQVLTTTFSTGKAGNLTVNVTDFINLTKPSNISTFFTTGLFATSSTNAGGSGGNINITTGALNINNGAAVSVSGEGVGNAGNIEIFAENIFLNNGKIIATSNSGEGGNINLQVGELLLLQNNSEISTRAGTGKTGGGNGGNININAPFIIAFPNQDNNITANAFTGNGGNININSEAIFGIYTSEKNFPNSNEITASSELGIDGRITINTIEGKPESGLIQLTTETTDPTNKITRGCSGEESSFIITGRGGIPDNPTQILKDSILWEDRRNFESNKTLDPVEDNNEREIQQIVEATGWIIGENGRVILTATYPQNQFLYVFKCN